MTDIEKLRAENERLREEMTYWDGYYIAKSEFIQGVQEMEDENERLRAALEPFARAAATFDTLSVFQNPEQYFAYGGIRSADGATGYITVAHLRRARAVWISGIKNYVTFRDRIERVLKMYNEIDRDANLRAALEGKHD